MSTPRKPRRMAREPQQQDGATSVSRAAAGATLNQDEAAPPKISKKNMLIAMLTGQDGASLAAIVAATGWLAHTTRAALTGLRKQGHAVERFKLGDETRYRIAAGAAAQ